ncbi:MAG: PorT family protein [Bacteroidetes bacterium]|nr:MAG: PorT family protein [Bacteroidota bacterium]
MKKAILTIMALLMINVIYGQFTLGPRVGFSSSSIDFDPFTIGGETISSGNATTGFHAGIFSRITLGFLYIQPEALFTQSGGEIQLDDGVLNDIREIEFNKLDFPVMLGTRFLKVLRVQAGPTLSLLLDAKVAGLEEEIKSGYKDATIGYQAGVGLDLWNLVLDLKYEGNLSTFGDELFGFATDQTNNQWILSVGFKLF